MFDYLLEDNDMKPAMVNHGLVLPEDLDFIKEQIAGPLDASSPPGEELSVSDPNMTSVSQQLHQPISCCAFISTVAI